MSPDVARMFIAVTASQGSFGVQVANARPFGDAYRVCAAPAPVGAAKAPTESASVNAIILTRAKALGLSHSRSSSIPGPPSFGHGPRGGPDQNHRHLTKGSFFIETRSSGLTHWGRLRLLLRPISWTRRRRSGNSPTTLFQLGKSSCGRSVAEGAMTSSEVVVRKPAGQGSRPLR